MSTRTDSTAGAPEAASPPEESVHARIARWAVAYKLTAAEIDRLNTVREDYPAVEVDAELLEELRCVLAARELAATPELTPDQVTRARAAFESGRTPFVAQDVD